MSYVYENDVMAIVNIVYPVGSYYETSDANFNPNAVWGGTWVLEAEGIVHISGTANGTYKVGTKYGANTKKIEDANIAHGHGFTMPTMASSGSGTSGDGGSHSGTLDIRFWGTGHAFTGAGGVFSIGDVSSSANALGAASNNPKKIQRATLSVGNHKHSTPNHTHTWSKNGSVNNLGTPSSRSNFNVMQESLAVYRWHRIA